MNRIAVIGISGSGKSTFARALGAKLALPVLHGDQIDWMPDWGVRPDADIAAIHKRWIEQPCWIIEGWVEADRAERLSVADLVVDLDYPGWLCGWRVLQRQMRGVRRQEMPDGCVDGFSPQTLRWVFTKAERPSGDAALKAATVKKYVRLTSPREAAAWLAAL
jgi:adenylate kinase family enzyme